MIKLISSESKMELKLMCSFGFHNLTQGCDKYFTSTLVTGLGLVYRSSQFLPCGHGLQFAKLLGPYSWVPVYKNGAVRPWQHFLESNS